MKQHEATEIAYKNGYEKGKADAIREMKNFGEVRHGEWRRMYRQYQCSSCGAVIDERQDNYLYGMIDFGERKSYCYWCGSCNELERREK